MTLAFMLYINNAPKYETPALRRIEIFNEFIFMIVQYHMIVSANNRVWVNEWIKVMVSTSMIIFIMLILVTNTVVIVISVLIDLKHSFKLWRLKRKQKKLVNEMEDAKKVLRKYVDASHDAGVQGKTQVLQEFDREITKKANSRLLEVTIHT